MGRSKENRDLFKEGYEAGFSAGVCKIRAEDDAMMRRMEGRLEEARHEVWEMERERRLESSGLAAVRALAVGLRAESVEHLACAKAANDRGDWRSAVDALSDESSTREQAEALEKALGL